MSSQSCQLSLMQQTPTSADCKSVGLKRWPDGLAGFTGQGYTPSLSASGAALIESFLLGFESAGGATCVTRQVVVFE